MSDTALVIDPQDPQDPIIFGEIYVSHYERMDEPTLLKVLGRWDTAMGEGYRVAVLKSLKDDAELEWVEYDFAISTYRMKIAPGVTRRISELPEMAAEWEAKRPYVGQDYRALLKKVQAWGLI